jgi:hypothetical protein
MLEKYLPEEGKTALEKYLPEEGGLCWNYIER